MPPAQPRRRPVAMYSPVSSAWSVVPPPRRRLRKVRGRAWSCPPRWWRPWNRRWRRSMSFSAPRCQWRCLPPTVLRDFRASSTGQTLNHLDAITVDIVGHLVRFHIRRPGRAGSHQGAGGAPADSRAQGGDARQGFLLQQVASGPAPARRYFARRRALRPRHESRRSPLCPYCRHHRTAASRVCPGHRSVRCSLWRAGRFPGRPGGRGRRPCRSCGAVGGPARAARNGRRGGGPDPGGVARHASSRRGYRFADARVAGIAGRSLSAR